jgi:holo-ACP synthase/triphosphoribosyl-dephospho-CoA synthase
VQEAALDLMKRFFRDRLGSLVSAAALKGILYEVSVTPKPGLVDRFHSGAHRDMDFFTFIDSAAAILPYFRECGIAGFDSPLGPEGLFDALRPGGKAAECLMNRATRGVNVHKGLIFSFAVVSAAYGRLYQTADLPDFDALFSLCRAMTVRVSEDFSRASGTAHGEALYAMYGIQGIRGEAAAGFPSVRDYGYPALCRSLDAGHSLNDAGIAAFLTLLARVDDTNILYRSDITTLRRIQAETQKFLDSGPSMEAQQNKAAELDRRFTAQNISPGGCADLLGLTFFLYCLFQE